MKKRTVISLGQEITVPEAKANYLVRHGLARFPEVETAAAKAPANAAKAGPKTTRTKKASSKKAEK